MSQTEETLEPPAKRQKELKNEERDSSVPTVESPKEILERISRHCSCTVCLDIPRVNLYQCKNGHLMCSTCLSHLLADSRLKDEGTVILFSKSILVCPKY